MIASTSAANICDAALMVGREIDYTQPNSVEQLTTAMFDLVIGRSADSPTIGAEPKDLRTRVTLALNVTKYDLTTLEDATAILLTGQVMAANSLEDEPFFKQCEELATKVSAACRGLSNAEDVVMNAEYVAQAILYSRTRLRQLITNWWQTGDKQRLQYIDSDCSWLTECRYKAHVLAQQTLEQIAGSLNDAPLPENTIIMLEDPVLAKRWQQQLAGELLYSRCQKTHIDLGNISTTFGLLSTQRRDRYQLMVLPKVANNLEYCGLIGCVQVRPNRMAPDLFAIGQRRAKWLNIIPQPLATTKPNLFGAQCGELHDLMVEGNQMGCAHISEDLHSTLRNDVVLWGPQQCNVLQSYDGYTNLFSHEILQLAALLSELHAGDYSYNALSPRNIGRRVFEVNGHQSGQLFLNHLSAVMSVSTWSHMAALLKDLQSVVSDYLSEAYERQADASSSVSPKDRVEDLITQWCHELGRKRFDHVDTLQTAYQLVCMLPDIASWGKGSDYCAPEVREYLLALGRAKQELQSTRHPSNFLRLKLPEDLQAADICSLGILIYRMARTRPLHQSLDLERNTERDEITRLCEDMCDIDPTKRPTIGAVYDSVQRLHRLNLSLCR